MSITRIFDLLENYIIKFPHKEDVFAYKVGDKWLKITPSEYIENANNISYGLLSLGVEKDDKIATITNNRPEWNFVDMGILQAGAVHLPVYQHISQADFKYILSHSEVKYIFVANEEIYNKIKSFIADLPNLKDIYSFEKIPKIKHWREITELGKKSQNPSQLQQIKGSIKETDLATIIYTSGTTGEPKGVMLSHKNIVSNFLTVSVIPDIGSEGKMLSYLPLSHIYERMLNYMFQYLGISVYYAESVDKIADNLKEVRPEILTTVPRLLEKIYEKIIAKGRELQGLKKIIFFWALNLALQYDFNKAKNLWYKLRLKIADKLVFSKWREAIGRRLSIIVSGGAALQERLARLFWAIKIRLLEGYGLTETSPVIAVNTLKSVKIGTVGPIIDGISVKIADDGEILCKGPNVMLGYYKRSDLTAEVIDADGWFHTGDIGEFVDGRFLKITDRKKEIFKTSQGKYVCPQIIENKLKESPFIQQIMVIGENQKFVSALIVPSFEHIKSWCKVKGYDYPADKFISSNQIVIDRIQREIDYYNGFFGGAEQIKKFQLLNHEWSVQTGELTPTLKLKRKVIFEKYKVLIMEMYTSSLPFSNREGR